MGDQTGFPVLIDGPAIKKRVTELAEAIDADYEGQTPVLLGVLTGSFIFLADLCREMKTRCEIDFVRVDSYGGGTTSSGDPALTLGAKLDLNGRAVLVVDEIIDTGLTLNLLLEKIKSMGAADVKTVALINKRAKREIPLEPDYTGFTVENGFLVGYGLDSAETMRNLPYIAISEKKE